MRWSGSSRARARWAQRARLGVGICYALALARLGRGDLGGAAAAAGAARLASRRASPRADRSMRADPADGARALALFRSNRFTGLLLFAGFLVVGLSSAALTRLGAPHARSRLRQRQARRPHRPGAPRRRRCRRRGLCRRPLDLGRGAARRARGRQPLRGAGDRPAPVRRPAQRRGRLVGPVARGARRAGRSRAWRWRARRPRINMPGSRPPTC